MVAVLNIACDEANEYAAGREVRRVSTLVQATTKELKSPAKRVADVRKLRLYDYLARRWFGGAEGSGVLCSIYQGPGLSPRC